MDDQQRVSSDCDLSARPQTREACQEEACPSWHQGRGHTHTQHQALDGAYSMGHSTSLLLNFYCVIHPGYTVGPPLNTAPFKYENLIKYDFAMDTIVKIKGQLIMNPSHKS